MTKPREKTREELTAEIEDSKKKIRQYENREKMLRQKLSREERRTRSHRLIVRGAVFESIVQEAKTMTDEEAADLLRLALTGEEARAYLKKRAEDGNAGNIIGPALIPVSQMSPSQIWSNYVRYIGAGAVAAGGILSLIKSLPLIVRTFKQALKGYGKKADGVESRLTKDIPMMFVVLGIGVLAIIMWLIPAIPVNLLSAIIIIIFGFFFATVSSRMVGLVGSSNNPVSGMAIATLLISSAILKATGAVGMKGMVAAISIGSVICIIAAIAGDTSQDLKTGYIVGATPYKQQAGELIGVAVSAITVGGVLYLLNAAWGYGSTELPAPQATLMKMVVEGVMGNSLPWSLVFAGVAIAIVVEILQIPVLPFAVGLYLPIYLSTPIMVGGLVRLYFDKKKGITEEERKAKVNQGILYSSGLIAGEGLVGILLAVFAIIPVGADTLGDAINISKIINLGNIGGLVFFACLVATLVAFINKKEKKTK